MARGGKRSGAGRPKGSLTEKIGRIALELAKDGTSAVELMLAVMRDETQPIPLRLDCKGRRPLHAPEAERCRRDGSNWHLQP